MSKYHFSQVNIKAIKTDFSKDNKHRFSLKIPFSNRSGSETLCIIGQNPSYANSQHADKTLHYLEKLIYQKRPNCSCIIMINLFSRIDTKKAATSNLLTIEGTRKFKQIVNSNNEFLIVYGKLRNIKAYKFKKRAQQVRKMLVNKNVLKIDIGTKYAPHPGNPKLYYGNFCHNFNTYTFSDV